MSSRKILIIAFILSLLGSAGATYAAQQYFAKVPTTVEVNTSGALQVNPKTLSLFVLNGSMTSYPLSVTNAGDVPLTLTGANFTGNFPSGYFTVSLNDTGTVVNPQKTIESLLTVQCANNTPPGDYNGTVFIAAVG